MKKILLFAVIISTSLLVHATGANPEDSLMQYTGKYKFPDGSVVTEVIVTLDSGVLKANSALGNSALHLSSGDVFDIVAYGGTATFKRNAQNKISGVQIIVEDINIEGTKEESSSWN